MTDSNDKQDFNSFFSRWEQERKERKAASKQRLAELCATKGIDLITGEFDGSGDSGDFYDLKATTATGEVVELTKDEWYTAEEALFALLPGGWEINDGSSGTVWMRADGTCGGEIGWRVINVEYETIGDAPQPTKVEED